MGQPAHGRVLCAGVRDPLRACPLAVAPDFDRCSTTSLARARRNQQAGTLSGGEQQMLALARAFLQRPRLLMLDEPSLGLAPLVTREVFRVVADLNEKEGLAVLVVEQNAAIALGGAARVRARDRRASRSPARPKS